MAETSTSSQSSMDVLELTVKTLLKGAFTVKVSRDTTVTQLKDKLQPLSEIPATRQRLIFKGRVLRDEQTVQEAGIETGNAVHLVERPADAPPTAPPDAAGARGPAPPPPNGANMQDFGRFLGGVLSQLTGGAAPPVPGVPAAARGQQPQAQESMHLLVALHTFLQTLEAATQAPPPIPITSLHPRFQDGATQQYRWLTSALQTVLNPASLSSDLQAVLQQAVQELDTPASSQPPAAGPRPAEATTGTAAPAASSSGPFPTFTTSTASTASGPAVPPGMPFPPDGPRVNLRRAPAPPYPHAQLIIPAIVGLVQRTHDYMTGPLAQNLVGDMSYLRDVQATEGNRTEVTGRVRELTGRLHAAAALFTELARACAAACLAAEGNAAALAFNTAAVLNADGTLPSFPRLLPRSDAPHIAETFIVRGDVDGSQLPPGIPPFPPGMFMMPNMGSPAGTPGPTPTPADGSGTQTPAGTGPTPGMPDMGQPTAATAAARFGPFMTPGGATIGGFSIQGEGPMDIGQQLMSMFSTIPGAQVVQGPTTTTIAVTSTQFPGEEDIPPPPPPPPGTAPPNASAAPGDMPPSSMPDMSNMPDMPFPDIGAIRIDMADVSLPHLLQQFQGMMGANFMQPPPLQQSGQPQQQQPGSGGPSTAGNQPTGPDGRPDMSSLLQALSPVIQNIVQNVVSNIVQASSTQAPPGPTTPDPSTRSTPAGIPNQPELRSAVADAVSAGLETVLSTISRNLPNIETGLRQVEQRTGQNADFMEIMRQLTSVLANSFQPQGAASSTPAGPTSMPTRPPTTSTPAPPAASTPPPQAPPANASTTTTTTTTTTTATASREASATAERDSAPGTSNPAASAPSMPPRGMGGGLRATSAKRKAVSAAAKSAAAASKAEGQPDSAAAQNTDAEPATTNTDWRQLIQAAEVLRSNVDNTGGAPSAPTTGPTIVEPSADPLSALMGGMGGLGGLASQLAQSNGSGGGGAGGGGGLGNLFQMAGRIAADPTMRPMIEQAASELFGGGSSGGGGLGNLLGSLLGGGGAAPRSSARSRSAHSSAPSWDALSSLGSPEAGEWRNIIEHDETEQLLMSEQPEFSDTYLAGAPPRGRSLFKKSDAVQN